MIKQQQEYTGILI